MTLAIISITAALTSIVLPTYRAMTSKFTGRTYEFLLQIFIGGAGGLIAYGGLFSAYIWEDGISFPIYRGEFLVYMFGVGAGPTAGMILSDKGIPFQTNGKRKIRDFVGIGNITAYEAGFVVVYHSA